MPDATEPASLVLAGLVLIAAGFLGWRQWRDVRGRPADLTPPDERYYARQDLRRLLGTIVLTILAVGLVLGGRLQPRVGGMANLAFIRVWAAIAFLMVALLVLAFFDWVATRAFERRHRSRLTREGLAIVEAELRARLALKRAEERDSIEDDL